MIDKMLLGRTGIEVSRIGLGTVKFGRNQAVHYPESFDLPSDEAILALLDCAHELGINLLDTAPAYGISEERLGKLIKNQRDRWIICTKIGEEFVAGASLYDFSRAATRKSIERSLKRLGTEQLDIVLVHSNGEDQKIIEEQEVLTVLAELKAAGLIRAFGMSTKTVAGGLLAVDRSDVVMVMHNPANVGEQPVIAHAHKHNKGILIKKALASGHLQKIADANPVASAMDFIFQEPGVTSVILGTLNSNHLKENVKCAERAIMNAGIVSSEACK
ncbi:MAG: aldo/keto reductase [Gammaproteobacteria bacterium]|nr:aldo/keto reductase [Gammaproteobacteria bacterium]